MQLSALPRYIPARATGGLAQLARAVGSQSTGQGFESPILHSLIFRTNITTSAIVFLIALLLFACDDPAEQALDLDSVPEDRVLVYPDDFDIEQTEASIRERFGDPQRVEEVEIDGTGDAGEPDIRRTFHYDGIDFIFYQSIREEFHILAATVLTSDRYAIDLGLRIGMHRSVSDDILGQPDFVQDRSHVYSFAADPTERLNIELVIVDDIIEEIAISPDIP